MSEHENVGKPDEHGRHDLFVSGDRIRRRRLSPADSPVRFGRSKDADLQICRRDDTEVPRWAGSLLFHDGYWYVYNDSGHRPFSVVVEGAMYGLHPVRPDGTAAYWAVSPPGLTLHFVRPVAPVEVAIETAGAPPPPVEPPDGSSDGPRTPRGKMRPSDRLRVSAKFLAHGSEGPILGDKEAAALAKAHLPPGEDFSHLAVMNAVIRARQTLTDFGVPDLGGASNMRRLRDELLCWGLLSEDDGDWLRDRPARQERR